MGLFTNDIEDINKIIRENFGEKGEYLLVFKHNSKAKGLGKLLLSTAYSVFDNNRTFILYFDQKGIYESEISNSLGKDFVFMAWHEIEDISLNEGRKTILKINHLGKNMAYEIPFDGKIFVENDENLAKLRADDFMRM